MRSSWWNSRSPTPIEDGLTTHAPRLRAASTAPPLPIIIVRINVSPSAGTRGRTGAPVPAPRTDVDRDDGSLVARDEQVGRQVVEHAAVDEQPAVVLGQGREEHR